MKFTSHSDGDRAAMLQAIGVPSLDELVQRLIPRRFLLEEPLNLPDGVSEMQLEAEFHLLADSNTPAVQSQCFLGGGAYDHYIPAAVQHILGRSEYYTAYTPYQAEVSQGTLQTIYEFQTMVCRLTGMEVANASHYDGATALAEGVLLAVRKSGRRRVALPFGLNPAYRQVLETYCTPTGVELVDLPAVDGRIDPEGLDGALQDMAALVVQHPNFFGLLEPVHEAAAAAHRAGAFVVSSTHPLSLAVLEPPGDWGADIATAEGQPFGIPTSLGGPYVGLMAVRKELVRMMPGRLVARAQDHDAREGYVLTLQTREQHIRREKATSNICSNEALMALAALVYVSLVGPDGLKRAALNGYRGAHYLAGRLAGLPGCSLPFGGEFFNEFVLELPKPAAAVQAELSNSGRFVGPPLGGWFDGMENRLLVAVTEKRNRGEMDGLVGALQSVLG